MGPKLLLLLCLAEERGVDVRVNWTENRILWYRMDFTTSIAADTIELAAYKAENASAVQVEEAADVLEDFLSRPEEALR